MRVSGRSLEGLRSLKPSEADWSKFSVLVRSLLGIGLVDLRRRGYGRGRTAHEALGVGATRGRGRRCWAWGYSARPWWTVAGVIKPMPELERLTAPRPELVEAASGPGSTDPGRSTDHAAADVALRSPYGLAALDGGADPTTLP